MSGCAAATSDLLQPDLAKKRRGGRLRRNVDNQPEDQAIAAAWERCVAGQDLSDEVRPQILASWLRCRDEYNVDPWQERAPTAPDEGSPHALRDNVVLAELGGIAKSLETRAQNWGGLVSVADAQGQILAEWGDRRAMVGARERNFARWAAWSERNVGTNGLGTVLESTDPMVVRKAEHWCAAFRDWTCAGIAVRDPLTGRSLGLLNISVSDTVPDATLDWLRELVAPLAAELRQRAKECHSHLLSVFAKYERTAHGLLLAADNCGRVVAANDEGRRLIGLSPVQGATNSIPELEPETFKLRELVMQAVQRAHVDKLWVGSAHVALPALDGELPVTLRPVSSDDRVVGVLISSEGPEGEQLAPPAPPKEPGLPRVLGVRARRLVLLSPEEIRYAQAEGNTVWLATDQGRLRGFSRGLGAVEEKVAGHGFLRVNRNYLVNLNRVREIAMSFKGGFGLVIDGAPDVVPVSRRHAAEVRRSLGL